MKWPFFAAGIDSAGVIAGADGSSPGRGTGADRDVVVGLAERFLPEDVRDRWVALLQPAVRLVPGGDGDGWLARLGGLPNLPVDEPWPVWEDRGSLSYVGEIDCAPLAGFGLSWSLPSAGRLLFFYFDGTYDQGVSPVGYWEPSSAQGARTVFVPAGMACELRPVPEGLKAFGEARFVGQAIVTAPDWEHPDLRAEFVVPGEDHRSFMDHPVCGDDFQEALYERYEGPRHQIGGYASPVQGPVEHEVAQFRLGGVPWDDERLAAEASRWELLLQVDSDDDLAMMWGDVGMLYWLGRPADLARGDLTEIGFTWQCG